MMLSRVHRFLAMSPLGAVDNLLKDLQLLRVSLAQILADALVGQEIQLIFELREATLYSFSFTD